ncbi:thioredoxin family protein [Spirosoma endbachense]|uniref:Thioredoxin domain-containing protein n=1 Tax=Spirosoma endbachense TaxID=2666025 RepID=A0A6P1VPX3_9BACT|nr:thioredoxin family protein [Spirosoma endbachense]QHV94172.1 hypothetical protein GJR95_03625 [Spirosoma endbachense]
MLHQSKQLLRFFIICFWATWLSFGSAFSQSGKEVQPGIRFLNGTFQQAVAAAKTARKPLFLEIYLTGCPHCEALAPILTEKQVGDFFNANFISWKAEANSPESKTVQTEKGLTYPEFPVLLFLDTNGKLMHVATPAERPTKAEFIDEVIQHGRTALDPKQNTSGYAARFQAGDRDLGFLINFGKYTKTTKDTTRLHQINDALGKLLVLPQDITSQTGFYVLQRLTDDIDNPLATYFFGHLTEFSAKYSAKDVKEAGEGIIFRALYGAKGDSYPAAKIIQMREYMVGLGVSPTEASARTLLKELDAHLRARNTSAAVQRFNEYRKQSPRISLADYAYLMHYFNEKATDDSYLPLMPVWATDGIRLVMPAQQNTKQVADLYYELALAYQKMGQKPEALSHAQKGLAIARIAKLDTKRYEAQVAKLK